MSAFWKMEGEADRRGNSCSPTAQDPDLMAAEAAEWGGEAAGKGKDTVV